MAKVIPFEAVHYNTERFGKDLSRFVAPPYDVIDRVLERRLKSDRLNIAHITLGNEDDEYAIARRRLDTWLNDGVLVRDEGKSFYIYEQTFSDADGVPRIRSGIIGLVKLEDFSSKIIMPHEKTIPKHKADRLEHMMALQGNSEQIFLMYDDPTEEVEDILRQSRKQEEILRFIDFDGVHHRIIRMTEEELINKMGSVFDNAKLLIADGHHRYETALEYRNKMRARDKSKGDEPYDFILATLVSFRNPGLVIYPTHRLVQGVDPKLLGALPKMLDEEFITKAYKNQDELAKVVEKTDEEDFGVWIPSSKVFLSAHPKNENKPGNPMEDVPVYMVQERVLKRLLGFTAEMLDKKINIEYVKGTGPSKDLMETGEYQACFFLKPPSAQQVLKVALTGEKLPHKSTYFYPKIWAGTVLCLHWKK